MKAQTRYKLEQSINLLSDLLDQADELDTVAKDRLEQGWEQIAALLENGANGMHFHSWLELQRDRTDQVGELARLAAKDKRWPSNGKDSLVACAARLEIVNLTAGGPSMKGVCGADLVERYLYPAWEEFEETSRRRPRTSAACAGSRRH